MPQPVTIVIPNYNGLDLLKAHIPSVLEALSLHEPGGELVVVDDASTDGSAAWLESQPHALRCIRHEANRGFAGACTTGIEAARHPVVVLLNSDADPMPRFLEPLAACLEREDVFAVGCLAMQEDGVTVGENVKVPHFVFEKLRFRKFRKIGIRELQQRVDAPLPSFFASGGFMALKAALFRELGGFDPLFEPFYYEDVDLCYRAWKRGYTVLFEPRSVVVHRHRAGSILAHNRAKHVDMIMERNRFLFTWKNLTGLRLFWCSHAAPLLFRIATKWLALDFTFYAALFGALGRFGDLLHGRGLVKKSAVRTDREIFEEIRSAAPPGIR